MFEICKFKNKLLCTITSSEHKCKQMFLTQKEELPNQQKHMAGNR